MSGVLCRYSTDSDGRLTFVDDGWCAFAMQNAAPQLADRERLYGKPLLSSLTDPTTLHIYALLMDRVITDHQTLVVPFRCDAPSSRRWLELEMKPGENGGVEFASRQRRAESRAPAFEFAGEPTRPDILLRMCSWCKDIAVAEGEWRPIEHAVERLGMFGHADVPLISHGICPDCVGTFESGARR